MKRKKDRDQRKSVEISCVAQQAQQVFVAGTFNNWNPSATPMYKIADGTWHVTLELPPGGYEYKFVVDSHWACEPGVDENDPKLSGSPEYIPNIYGSMNRRLTV